jgi:hypothetical protein
MWLILNGFFSALSVALCIYCAIRAISAAQRAARVSVSVQAKLASCELRIESLLTSRDGMVVALDALAQRVKMQRVRAATDHAIGSKSDMPDPYKDPDGWRAAMNAKIAGIGRGG